VVKALNRHGLIRAGNKERQTMNQTSAHDPLHDVPEASVLLRVAPLTIYKWIGQRKLGCVRLGRAVRIPESEIKRLIEEGTCPARRRR